MYGGIYTCVVHLYVRGGVHICSVYGAKCGCVGISLFV